MENRVPQLGGSLQTDIKEMARASRRAEGAVFTTRARQPQRYSHEEGSTGTNYPFPTSPLAHSPCVLTTTHCVVLTGAVRSNVKTAIILHYVTRLRSYK